ncbi:MAG: serine/threonine protein kinase [Planctomycetaceae bacterium]|nr:serine/threonine protein kinase [Planctomycetaceae bacterium]
MSEETGFHLIGFPTVHDEEGLRARQPFEVLASQFVEELRLGQKPSVERYARRYPPHADRIRECFPVLAILEQARLARETETFRHNMPGKFPFTRLGRCELLCELGRGGMGVVFQARDSLSDHIVAIKVLPWRVSIVPTWQQRFETEARMAAQLRHPNIVPVFRFGQQHGYCYFVMQFVNGVGLDVIIDRLREANGILYADEIQRVEASRPAAFVGSGAIPALREDESLSAREKKEPRKLLRRDSWTSFTRLAIQTTQALRCAHAAGILHNDIKPGNLLIDSTGRVWVTDFGVAQPFESNAAIPHHVAGTLRFMAPERVMGTPHDVRSDLYSLGATLYELCTLQPMLATSSRDQLIESVLEDEPIAPRTHVPSMPKDLETVILNCVQRHPDDRYTTADSLLADLLKFSRGQRVASTRRRSFSGFFRTIQQSVRPRYPRPGTE